MDIEALRQRTATELCVAIEEEWGYKQYIWFPKLSSDELEAWWLDLEDVETFWQRDMDTGQRAHVGWPGLLIDAEEPDELYVLWSGLWDTAPYVAHIDMNAQLDLARPDTFLRRRSDGKVFVHKGATGENE